MAFPQREATFVPGGLSSKHAQILDNRIVSERCSLCHPNSHTRSTATGAIATQDELCSRCHEGHLPKLHLRSPHDIERSTLRQLTMDALTSRGVFVSKRENNRSSASALENRSASDLDPATIDPQFTSLLASSEMETACASCHVEHHGRNNPLQAITDARCQACHAKQFDSFVNGHPEFGNYPVAQTRSIAFTHQAHLEKHFAKKNESFDCTKCHLDSNQRGGVGSVFRTLSFETACARCHDESINAASVDGWVLLQLPSIQPNDAQQTTLGLTDWPTTAQFGYDGNVPLVMRALLMADANTTQALKQLPTSGQIKAMPNFAQMGHDATLSIATGTRTLINDIAVGGQAAWRKRLETVLTESLARDLSATENRLVDNLCAGLPPDIFRQMQQNWFGAGQDTIAAGEKSGSSANGSVAQLVSAQDDDLLLSSTKEEDDDLLGAPQQDKKLPAQAESPEADDSLLLGNQQEPLSSTMPQNKPKKKLTKLRGAIHVVQGGWYLDNETLSLRYMPRGHNDPTLAAWSEFVQLLAVRTPSHGELSKQVPGGCTQCHVLNNHVPDDSSFNLVPTSYDHSLWKASSKSATVRSITKFDHTPHLTLPTLTDCKYCHQLDLKKDARTSHQFTSTSAQAAQDGSELPICEFKSMHIDQCSACHRPNAASTGCTQCHNYHVTDRP